MRLINLTKDQVAIVDDEDFEHLSQWSWHAWWSKNTHSYYAVRDTKKDGRKVHFKMHRQVLGITDPHIHVDHRNSDTLDNRKSNLRTASVSQNNWNQRKHRNNTTGFKGITFHRASGLYLAQISAHGKRTHLGCRPTAEAAFRELYEPAVRQMHGEFGNLGLAARARRQEKL